MKTNQKTIAKQTLSREEMKNVKGGNIPPGKKCVLYCCPSLCSSSNQSFDHDCKSNEECQDLAVSNGGHCHTPGDYVAALCKG